MTRAFLNGNGASRNRNTNSPALNVFLWVLRVVIGCLFIFSGLVKANDPSGLANKMTEFFEPSVLNLPSLIPYALPLSVLMIGFEIIAGVAVLIGFWFRGFSFLLLLLNIFFTFLTGYVYYWDVIMHSAKVRECGCFGDCIKISNSETFWKDVILLAIALILFIFRNRIRSLLPKYPGTALIVLTIFLAFGIQWWALEHLPFYDCMPYKVGNNIAEKRKDPVGCVPDSFSTVMVYKNLKTGSKQEFGMDNFPWQDTLNWAFDTTMTKLVRKGNCEPEIKDFNITDYEGNDYTDAVLQQPGQTLVVFLKKPEQARWDNIARLQSLAREAQAKGLLFIVLSSGAREATEKWRAKAALPGAEFYTFDGTASKTAMRTDPGLMLLEEGVIKGKWSFRDYPEKIPAPGSRVTN